MSVTMLILLRMTMNYLNAVHITKGMTITMAKEHELKSYETLGVIVGLFLKFTIVKLKGPNKQFKH